MPVYGVSEWIKAIAGWLKFSGAVLFTLMVAKLVAFSCLLAGSAVSAVGAIRRKEWMTLCIDSAFIAANASAIFRTLVG